MRVISLDERVPFSDGSRAPLRDLLTTEQQMVYRHALVSHPDVMRNLPGGTEAGQRAALGAFENEETLPVLEKQTRSFWAALVSSRNHYKGGLPLIIRNVVRINARATGHMLAREEHCHEMIFLIYVAANHDYHFKNDPLDPVTIDDTATIPTFSPLFRGILDDFRWINETVRLAKERFDVYIINQSIRSHWRKREGALLFESPKKLYTTLHLLRGNGTPRRDMTPANQYCRHHIILKFYLWYLFVPDSTTKYNPTCVFFPKQMYLHQVPGPFRVLLSLTIFDRYRAPKATADAQRERASHYANRLMELYKD